MALKPLNSVAGFSVGETPANIILANGDVTTTNITTTGVANLNAIGNVKISGGSNGQVIKTDGTGNLSFVTIDTWQIQNGNSNVQVLANSNVTVSVTGTANVATFTSTGMNVAGYISGSNITANGNVSVNNYIVTPSTVDLIVAPATQITRFYSNVNPFSGGYSLGNSLARWDNVFSNTANVSGNVAAGGLLTDNLYYANGNPWDLQEAAGSNTEIQFNDGNDNFGASANFTFDYATNLLTVVGNSQFNNANLGNLAIANFVNVSTNVNVTGTMQAGNVRTDNLLYANGNPWDLQEAAGSNTQVQYNDGLNNFGASANFTFDDAVSNLTVVGNIIATSFFGNISGNVTAPGANTQVVFNDANISNAVANFTYDKAFNSGGGRLNVGNTVGGQIITDNVFASYGNVGNLDVTTDIVAGGNISTSGSGGDITMTGGNITGANVVNANTFAGNLSATSANISGNTTTSNLTVNLALSGNTANFSGNVVAPNLTVNLALSGNTANFSGNVVVPNLTVNLELAGNTANFTGNVVAANLIGALANGSSNVKVFNNANVEVSIGGSANTATFASTGLYVVGQINTTAGNMLSNGNITANGFLNSANANVTGEAVLGSVLTSNITAPSGTITISAAGVDQNININPTGNGTVDVGSHRITQVGDPTQPRDAATKEYVDSTAQGLTIHTAVRVTSATNLNATYANGGSVLSTIAITGGKTIQFSAAHNLNVGDEISWDNSFNGIISDDPYFVYSTPAADTITVKAGYFGAEVTTLTNGTGLTQTARANTGVGATLTNAGANAAISIDGVSLSSTNRVLVQGQTNQVENGIYTVTTVGNGSTAWVLTRATDEDTYSPTATNALGYGDYFFVQQGSSYAGSSYVLTTPVGEILFGYTNIEFSQFSAAGSYSAGNGIAITGTTISANVDLETTDIVGGNIVVKTSANLTTPNIGDASFSSLSWNNLSNGNVTANNLSIGNIANITGNLRVDGIIQSNGNVTSNATVNGNNASFTNYANIGGNLSANNITSNNEFSTTNANISTNLVTSNATVNLSLSGNTANFSGNVVVPNLTVNLELAGNTANFSGNIVALNTNAGNLLTANFANIASNITTSNLTVNLELAGNTANFSGNVIVPNLTVNTALSGNTANFSGNVVVPNLTVNLELAGNTANFSGNIKTLNANLGNLATANYVNVSSNTVTNNLTVNLAFSGNTANFSGNITSPTLTANNTVIIGESSITWGNVTTSAVTANQTISSYTLTGSGVTGIEWLVKGVDDNLVTPKYSVATIQAVTDGTSVDFTSYGTVQLGGSTGSLAVNIVGSTVRLQVTPSSSNTTTWVTQYRTI